MSSTPPFHPENQGAGEAVTENPKLKEIWMDYN